MGEIRPPRPHRIGGKTNMNVKSVEKENGNAKIAIEIEKAEF